ncbi:MAG: ABC transporter substrate-binding protein [Lautropia sp.]
MSSILRRRRFLAGMAAVWSAAIGSAPRSVGAQTQPVKLGVIMSLSGPAAVLGLGQRDAINAIHRAHGGVIHGHNIELVFYDDKSNPTEAARGVTLLASEHKVAAIIGPTTGSSVLAAAPVAARREVPLLAAVGTAALTDRKNDFFPWLFRTTVNDTLAAPLLFETAAKAGAKRIGVIYTEDAYGKYGLELAKELAPALGFTLAESVSAPYTATDLTPHAIKLRNANVDAVVVQIALAGLGAAFVNAAQEVGLKAKLYGVLGLSQQSFLDAAGAKAEGMHIVAMGDIDVARGKELADLLIQGGAKPQGMAEFLGSNSMMAAVAALKEVRAPVTGKSMREALERTCGFQAYGRGTACFGPDNHDGWGKDGIAVGVVKGGRLRLD